VHIRYAGSRSRHDERAGGRGPSHGNAGLRQGDKAIKKTRRAVVELIQQLDCSADAVTSRAVVGAGRTFLESGAKQRHGALIGRRIRRGRCDEVTTTTSINFAVGEGSRVLNQSPATYMAFGWLDLFSSDALPALFKPHDGACSSAFRIALYLGPHARLSKTSTMSWHFHGS